jgi:FtsZ-binding cell division protein ZapB
MTSTLFDITKDTVQVDARSFETLEAKINDVLERLGTLQAEKQELQRQVDIWRGRSEEAERKIEELTREKDALKLNQRDTEQDELIRSKIEALLSKLEAA